MGRRDGREPDTREVQISKKMSYLLRHGAEKEGVKLDENGYMKVTDLLNWNKLKSAHLTFPELRDIVRTNAKQRFQLILTPAATTTSSSSPADYLIRAAQGHSIPIDAANIFTELKVGDADLPRLVVHGTNTKAWNVILASGGLKKMARNDVHFATGMPSKAKNKPQSVDPERDLSSAAPALASTESSATPQPLSDTEAEQPVVISGMRTSADILIWVDTTRAVEEGGVKWWRSANGVVLTEGDGEGLVRCEWIDRVERRDGSVVWRPEAKAAGEE